MNNTDGLRDVQKISHFEQNVAKFSVLFSLLMRVSYYNKMHSVDILISSIHVILITGNFEKKIRKKHLLEVYRKFSKEKMAKIFLTSEKNKKLRLSVLGQNSGYCFPALLATVIHYYQMANKF